MRSYIIFLLMLFLVLSCKNETNAPANNIQPPVEEPMPISNFDLLQGHWKNEETGDEILVAGNSYATKELDDFEAQHPFPLEPDRVNRELPNLSFKHHSYKVTKVTSDILEIINTDTISAQPLKLKKINQITSLNLGESINYISGKFQGQRLEDGERVIRITWDNRNIKEYPALQVKHMSYVGKGYASTSITVPQGKKLILLYIHGKDASKLSSFNAVPTSLFSLGSFMRKINLEEYSLYNNEINILEAKESNPSFRYEELIAISYDTKAEDFQGEIWFLEMNDE